MAVRATLENTLGKGMPERLRYPGGLEVSEEGLLSLIRILVSEVTAALCAEPTLDGQRLELRPCAVFDADGTLWREDLPGAVVREALAQGGGQSEALEPFNRLFDRYGEPLAATPEEALERLRDAYLSRRLFSAGKARGWSPRQVDRDVWPTYNWVFAGWTEGELEAFTQEVLTHGLNEIYPMREVLDILRDQGIQPFVVSAGVEPVARVAAAQFGFSPLEVRGQRSLSHDGVLCAEIEAPLMYGQGKLEVCCELCQGLPFFAFADSVAGADWEMMDDAYLGIAVHPEGSHRDRAREEGFVILNSAR